MSIVAIILLSIFYIALVSIIYEYNKLFSSKDQYTKQELKQVVFYIPDRWVPILSKFRFFPIFAIGSLLVGIVFHILSMNWLVQSSVVTIVVFFVLSQIKRIYEPMKVTVSDSLVDTIAAALSEYYEVIIFFFSAGALGALTYNWVTYKELSFLWFLVNFVVIAAIMFFIMSSLDIEESGKDRLS